ncbi:MAG: FHA domain-containing protein [Anaerolineaceae bacterium]|nr:MAG: FHA domain-containing protein [Anaerolineaceae bacterium]
MSTAAILLILRISAALLLLLILALMFYAIWREHRTAIERIKASKRSYGRLAKLIEADGQYITTGESAPLLPLTTLGRARSNSVHIDDTFASSEHARVFLRDGQWWLEDRHSRNGTLLNNLPVKEPIILTSEDIISIGETHYRLEIE